MKTLIRSALAVLALATALFAADPQRVTAALPPRAAGAKAALDTQGMRVTHEGTTRYAAGEAERKPHILSLQCPSGLAAGTRVRLVMGGFRSLSSTTDDSAWILRDVIAVGGGKITVEKNVLKAADTKNDPLAGFWGVMRSRIDGTVQRFAVVVTRVGTALPAGASVVFRFDGKPSLSDTTPLAGFIQIEVAGASANEFHTVGDPVKFKLLPAKPAQIEVRVKSMPNAKGNVRVSIFMKDRFDNVTTPMAGTVQLEVVSGEFQGLPATLDWQMAKDSMLQPEGIRVKRKGAARIKVTDQATGSDMTSAAILPAPIQGQGHFFGDLHWHTEFSWDANHPMRDAYAYARDTLCLDVLAASDHDVENLPWWKQAVAINDSFYCEGRFVTFPGFEHSLGTGHINTWFRSPKAIENTQVRAAVKSHSASRLNAPADVIVAPHCTMAEGHPDFAWNSIGKRMRMAEMIQLRGCSETTVEDKKWGINPRKSYKFDGSLRSMLDRGWHIGFYGGSDNHMGLPTKHIDERNRAGESPQWRKNSNAKFYAAMTGFVAKELTRDAIWQTMDQRHVYATSGMPIICHVDINGALMGSEIKAKAGQPVQLYAQLHGTAPIERVEIISGGQCIKAWEPGKLDVEIQESLPAPPAGKETYYYLRLLQTDGHRAWASPVWVTVP